MLHHDNGVSICGPCTCPCSKSSCVWSSQHWARKSAQTHLPAGRARWFQDLTHPCTVVTVQPSTACSSIGLNPSRSDSTRHGIYCLKFWKSFERQEQEVSWSTPTGPFSHGLKKCRGFPSFTSACHLLVSSLQITSSYSPGKGQAAYRTRPLQPQRGNGQTSNDLRGSSHDQVGRQVTRLHTKSGCGECVLSRTHSSEAPQNN
jgi:hypothetical protein